MAIRDNQFVISINLNCYVIRFKKKGTPDTEFLPVNEVLGEASFAMKMQKLIEFFDTTFENKTADRILYLHKLDPNYSANTLNGLIRRGVRGQETYIDEISKDGKKKASTIATVGYDQYNSTHFFFSLCQPTADSKGILFLAQSFKQYGFKELFEEALRAYTSKINDKYTCFITQLSVPALFDKLLDNGLVKKLTFKKHSMPSQFENSFLQEDSKNVYDVNLSVVAKKGSFENFKSTLKTFRNSDTTLMEVFPIDAFEYDDLSAEIFLGGKRRIFNMKKPSDFGTYYDLTDLVDLDENTKHANYDQLKLQAEKIATEDILPNIQL